MKRLSFAFCLIFCSAVCAFGHSSYIMHGEDIMAVLGFKHDTRLFSKTSGAKNKSWVKFVSSDMIDNTDFHKELEESYPGLSLKTPRRHRMLFHWAFDVEPWSPELEKLFVEYCDVCDLNVDSNVRVLKSKLVSEQKRRNRLILDKTQEVFGFVHGGRKERTYTHFFAAMAYNIHILGDYMTDNKVLYGLYGFDKLIGRIVVDLRNLDYEASKEIVRGITKINRKDIDVQVKADEIMAYLKQTVPGFIQSADNGSIRKMVEAQGFAFRPCL